MDLFEDIFLEDCPCCGGAGLIEEEGGWCVYVQCLDCGAHTSAIGFEGDADKPSGPRTTGTCARSSPRGRGNEIAPLPRAGFSGILGMS